VANVIAGSSKGRVRVFMEYDLLLIGLHVHATLLGLTPTDSDLELIFEWPRHLPQIMGLSYLEVLWMTIHQQPFSSVASVLSDTRLQMDLFVWIKAMIENTQVGQVVLDYKAAARAYSESSNPNTI
jgi:hypothetical protein